jgi:hypothetical protein
VSAPEIHVRTTGACLHLRQAIVADDGEDMGKRVLADVVMFMPCAYPGCPQGSPGDHMMVMTEYLVRESFGRAPCGDGHYRWFKV